MALIYCRNCGNQISDKAAACPKCGTVTEQNIQEVKAAKSGSKKPVIIGSVIAVAACVAAVLVVVFTRNDGSNVKTAGKNTSYAANSMIVYDTDSKSTVQVGGGITNDPTGLRMSDNASNAYQEPDTEAVPECYDILISVKVEHNSLMAKYPVDFCIDGETVATIGDGDSFAYTYRLGRGLHKVTFKNNQEPDNEAYTLESTETVTGEYSTISYVIKRHTAGGNKLTGTKGIEIKDRSYS